MSNIELIEKIAANIIRKYDIEISRNLSESDYSLMTLSEGLPGLLMLLSELYDMTGKDFYNEELEKFIVILSKKLAKRGLLTASLFSGASGISLSILHLLSKETKYHSLIVSLHRYILYHIPERIDNIDLENISPTDYDVIEGLSGILAYLLLQDIEDLDSTKYSIITFLSETLLNNTVKTGLYVKSQCQMTVEEERLYPQGCLNFGLAHGLAGVGIVLAYSKIKGFYTNESLLALEKIHQLYEKHRIQDGSVWKEGLDSEELKFGASISDISLIRDAWCYGSPGIALFYLYFGVAFEDNGVLEHSLLILKESFRQKRLLVSAMLCHGYAGMLEIGLFFKRVLITQYLDDEIETLYRSLIDAYDESREFGFKSEFQINGLVSKDSIGFLDGAVGILLSLIHLEKRSVSTFWHSALLLFDDLQIDYNGKGI